MSKSDFGLIGLAVMGQNLVLNVESRGFRVSGYNRTTETMEEFIAAHPGKNLYGAKTLEEFVKSLERPRKVMMLVQSKAGADPADRDAVDAVIDQVLPLLDEGDLIIDGGNTFFIHTERRSKALAERGLLYMGTGVSGGEEGARKGPAIMPGGPVASWEMVKPIFEAISAKRLGLFCGPIVFVNQRGFFDPCLEQLERCGPSAVAARGPYGDSTNSTNPGNAVIRSSAISAATGTRMMSPGTISREGTVC